MKRLNPTENLNSGINAVSPRNTQNVTNPHSDPNCTLSGRNVIPHNIHGEEVKLLSERCCISYTDCVPQEIWKEILFKSAYQTILTFREVSKIFYAIVSRKKDSSCSLLASRAIFRFQISQLYPITDALIQDKLKYAEEENMEKIIDLFISERRKLSALNYPEENLKINIVIKYPAQLDQLRILLSDSPDSRFVDRIKGLDLSGISITDNVNNKINLLLNQIVSNLKFLRSFTTFTIGVYPFSAIGVVLLKNIGFVYKALGGEENIRKGLMYEEKSLKMQQELSPGNDPTVVKLLNNLGVNYKELGKEQDIRKGIRYLEESYEMSKKLFSGNHSSMMMVLSNIGVGYLQLEGEEHLRKALIYLEESFKMSQALIPGNHPKIAELLHTMGIAYRELGGEENFSRGFTHLKHSVKMLQALFPGNNSGLAISLHDLGKAYCDLGGEENIRKGLKYQEDSLKMRQALLQP